MIVPESVIDERMKAQPLVVVNFDRDARRESWRLQFFVFLHFHALLQLVVIDDVLIGRTTL